MSASTFSPAQPHIHLAAAPQVALQGLLADLSVHAVPWSWGWGHLPESGKRVVVACGHCYLTVLQVVWFCSSEPLLNQAARPRSPQGRKGPEEP